MNGNEMMATIEKLTDERDQLQARLSKIETTGGGRAMINEALREVERINTLKAEVLAKLATERQVNKSWQDRFDRLEEDKQEIEVELGKYKTNLQRVASELKECRQQAINAPPSPATVKEITALKAEIGILTERLSEADKQIKEFNQIKIITEDENDF